MSRTGPLTIHTDRESSRGREVALERRAISITQACESVGVSRRTIYNWMAAGKVEYVRTAGGAVRIFEDSLWRSPQPGSVSPFKPLNGVEPTDRA